jgi:hypothetical protein
MDRTETIPIFFGYRIATPIGFKSFFISILSSMRERFRPVVPGSGLEVWEEFLRFLSSTSTRTDEKGLFDRLRKVMNRGDLLFPGSAGGGIQVAENGG